MTNQIITVLAERAPELLIIGGMLFIMLRSINRVVTHIIDMSSSIQQLHRDTLKIVEHNAEAMTNHTASIDKLVDAKTSVTTELRETTQSLALVSQSLDWRCPQDTKKGS